MSEIKRLANDWIQTQYESDAALVGRVTNPERERDYEAGYLAGARRGFEAARERRKLSTVRGSKEAPFVFKNFNDLLKALEGEAK